MKDILHFAHANGFTGGTYRVLTDRLSEHYQVHAIDRVAHNPRFPVTDNWGFLVDEMIHHFETSFHQPVIAVGHSLGGVLSLLTALRRPDLVKAVVMLDSPVMTPVQAHGMRFMKFTGLNERVFPIRRIEERQTEWQNLDEARDYFRGKSLMRDFDPRCLDDYIISGTEEEGGRLILRYVPMLEANIWRTIPHNIHTLGRLKVSGAVIGGRSSEYFKRLNGAYMKSRLGMKLKWTEGGHMYPLERPDETADLIHQVVGELIHGR
ncbi:alpha/beta fold hydrolase [Thalassolituus sp.]|jgi:pimeloyl-ACP methyl ester carboxylesterase|uniref:alpha/beta fold hydrolase n=1 Tax=Thalassolituus sp. TaxID=2030822 RepID=UPI003516E2BD|nr:MAG: alpha/beta hydrolase [Thalassolituus sp.]